MFLVIFLEKFSPKEAAFLCTAIVIKFKIFIVILA